MQLNMLLEDDTWWNGKGNTKAITDWTDCLFIFYKKYPFSLVRKAIMNSSMRSSKQAQNVCRITPAYWIWSINDSRVQKCSCTWFRKRSCILSHKERNWTSDIERTTITIRIIATAHIPTNHTSTSIYTTNHAAITSTMKMRRIKHATSAAAPSEASAISIVDVIRIDANGVE